MMRIRVQSIFAAAIAALPITVPACAIDIDALTNGQCPAPLQAFRETCVDDVDECAAGLANCAPSATCKNTRGSFTCTCPAGALDVHQDGTQCAPNGCASPTITCDSTATCTSLDDGIQCTCPPGSSDVNGDGTKCTTGDSCATPVVVDPLSLPVKLTGTTVDGTPHYGFGPSACPGVPTLQGVPSNDKVYSFTPTTAGDYLFRLTTTTFDAVLYVVENCGSIVTTCLGAANTTCINCTESLVAHLAAGKTYFVVVDGSGNTDNHAGSYAIDIRRNTIQIDVSAVLLHDTVANNGMGGLDPTQDSVDGFMAVPTQSVATMLGGAGALGLPDDAFFPADLNHAALQLHWRNTDDGPNSRVVLPGEGFMFSIPKNRYHLLQIYGFSTNGGSVLTFTLSYDDGTSDVLTDTSILDWYSDSVPPGQFIIINDLDRYYDGILDPAHAPAVRGINLKVDPKKTLVSAYLGYPPGSGEFIFYGATAQ